MKKKVFIWRLVWTPAKADHTIIFENKYVKQMRTAVDRCSERKRERRFVYKCVQGNLRLDI